jgi:hypothetical protein
MNIHVTASTLMKALLLIPSIILACTFAMNDEETSRWRGLICKIFPSLFTLALASLLNYKENSQNFK